MLLRDKLIKIDIPKRRTLERGIIRDTIENRILLSSEKGIFYVIYLEKQKMTMYLLSL